MYNKLFIMLTVCFLSFFAIDVPSFSMAASRPKAVITNEKILPYNDVDFVDISQDGKKIVFTRLQELKDYGEYGELWVSDSDGNNTKPILQKKDFGGSKITVSSPKISPDGSKVVFSFDHGLVIAVITLADKDMQIILKDDTEKSYPFWSPDGSKIYFYWNNPDTGAGTYWMWSDPENEEPPKKVLATDYKVKYINQDGSNFIAQKGQSLYYFDGAGKMTATKQTKSPLRGFESLNVLPNLNYIVIGNVLYDMLTGEESQLFPEQTVLINQAPKPNLIGPKSMSISADNSKFAFVLDCDCENYVGKLKILDVSWK